MAYIKVRVPRTNQPQELVGIDVQHALASKLRFLSPLGGNTSNVVNGNVNTEIATTKQAFKDGVATKFNGTSAYIQLPTTDLCSVYPITVSCWVDFNNHAGVLWSLNGTNYHTIFGGYGGDMLSSVSCAGGLVISVPSNGLKHVGYIARAGSFDVYLDGVLQTKHAPTGGYTNWGEPAAGYNSIGARYGGSSLKPINDAISDFAVFQGELTPDEILSLYQNTRQLYELQTEYVWIPDAVSMGGGTTYTLSPSGQVVFSGSSGISRNKLLQPSGQFILSGSAGTAKTRAINPSGQVIFSGNSALSLSGAAPSTYTLAPTGGFVLSGTPKLVKNRVFTPSGNVIFSGNNSLINLPAGGALTTNQRTVVGSGT